MKEINLNQYEAILFDWGDTIMKDFPDKAGKMRYWDVVEEVPNAKKILSVLSKKMRCYLATSAEHSTKEDIIEALKRVELNQYFTNIFCYRDVGCKKNESQFYTRVISQLDVDAKNIIMIGNDLENDVIIPVSCGIKAILFDPQSKYDNYHGDKLKDLIELLSDAAEQPSGEDLYRKV